jgi:hypothetical protein
MNRDPRIALSQELEAKQTLLDQLHALAADDPDFFTDLLEGETNLPNSSQFSMPRSSTTKPSPTAPKPLSLPNSRFERTADVTRQGSDARGHQRVETDGYADH